jgi:hypothetical protein
MPQAKKSDVAKHQHAVPLELVESTVAIAAGAGAKTDAAGGKVRSNAQSAAPMLTRSLPQSLRLFEDGYDDGHLSSVQKIAVASKLYQVLYRACQSQPQRRRGWRLGASRPAHSNDIL